jgi:hypothetical protein
MTNILKIDTTRQNVVLEKNFRLSSEFIKMREHFPKRFMINAVGLAVCKSYQATDGMLIVLRKKYNPSDDAIVNLKLPCAMAPSFGIEYFKTVYPQFAHINAMDNIDLMGQM